MGFTRAFPVGANVSVVRGGNRMGNRTPAVVVARSFQKRKDHSNIGGYGGGPNSCLCVLDILTCCSSSALYRYEVRYEDDKVEKADHTWIFAATQDEGDDDEENGGVATAAVVP